MATVKPTFAGSDLSFGDTHMILSHLVDTPYEFLKPSGDLYGESVRAAQKFLDPLATNLRESYVLPRGTRKRKRYGNNVDYHQDELQLHRLYVDGFSVEQIWGQATRILDATIGNIEHSLSVQAGSRPSADEINYPKDSNSEAPRAAPGDELSEHSLSTGSISLQESVGSGFATGHDLGERDQLSEDDHPLRSMDSDDANPGVYKEDPFGLNDGFFSIDDFNKQSLFFESQDIRGDDDDDDDDSGDESIDWHADALLYGAKPLQARSLKHPDREDDESNLEELDAEFGFGHVYSDAEYDSNIDMMGPKSFIDTNDIKYADFFAPPPRKAPGKKFRPLPKTQPEAADLENELDRAMADVRRDLFDDDVSDDGSIASPLRRTEKPQTGYSSHEKRQAQIANEIRQLEADNVAKKGWMLAGEARAVQRPLNSLIEEDLDFERTGKPVPVVTSETSEQIEALVKRRIVASEFDEVIRRLPTSLSSQSAKREKFELDDSKPQQSLAEAYEADHLRGSDPNRPSQKDQRLQTQHQAMLNFWREISSQLDSLSNWHYRPKAPSTSINIATDVATIMMEDARPAASGAVTDRGQLAPQEIYNPVNRPAVGGEVVLRSGAPLARDEMSREEKLKRRRRKKETAKKAKSHAADSQSSKGTQKADLLGQLRRGGVKVVGEKGQLKDLNGHRAKDGLPDQGGQLKL